MTIQEIKNLAKEREYGGFQTILEGDGFIISIVGGYRGLYGDFENDFEIAVMESEYRKFITKSIIEQANDDVMPYVSALEVEKIVNELLGVE